MMNTIRKVIIVVLVLITSCHVSENPNNGPLTAHPTINSNATRNDQGDPIARATACEAQRNPLRHTAPTSPAPLVGFFPLLIGFLSICVLCGRHSPPGLAEARGESRAAFPD